MFTREQFLSHISFWDKLDHPHKHIDYVKKCLEILHCIPVSNKQRDTMLSTLNMILEGYGITRIDIKGYEQTWTNNSTLIRGLAINTGDLYNPTIVYDMKDKAWLLTDLCSYRELVEKEYEIYHSNNTFDDSNTNVSLGLV